MKIKAIVKLPRLMTIPGLDHDGYRQLQAGEAVDVAENSGEHLVKRGFAEKVVETPTATGGSDGE